MEVNAPSEQAPAPSLQDRIGNIFGDVPPKQPEAPPQEAAPEEPAETPEGPAAEAPEETFEMEYEGTKYVLPKRLEKAVMQERDYTQKSQTLAEQRRTVEIQQEQFRIANMAAEFHKDAQAELSELSKVNDFLQQLQSLDWNQLDTEGKLQYNAELSRNTLRQAQLQKAVDEKQQQWTQKQREAIEALKAKSNEAISKRIPGWNKDVQKAVIEHAISEGYTQAELNSITDDRHAVTLWKAQQFDAIKANAKAAEAKAINVKTTPSNPMPQHVKDKLNFRKVIQKAPPNSPERRRAVEDRVASIFSR